ncbi:MAG: PAS domain-containing sensor histidine kinase [Candidatus Obscuribacterales bacterium]|jgi:PAS domain S-box-containing protein|nr:PAS domain-containing sensor histidine kinase [Candidatus Obscuribacterales bacterium]
MQPNSYETLKNWYLAKLRKFALDTAGEMTPSTLMAADKDAIERIIAERSDKTGGQAQGPLPASAVKFSLGGNALVDVKSINQSLTEMQSRITELSERENAIADFALDLICSIEENLKVCAVNPAIQVQTGHPPVTLVGHSIEKIISPEDKNKLVQALDDARKKASGAQTELQVKTISGLFRDYRWTFEWSESNNTFFCTARDITAEKQLERVKHEFIAMVSHDLRAPLMSVQLTLGLLTKFAMDDIPQEHREQVLGAETSVKSLIGLINDLLDLEKMEAGRLQLNMEEVMIQDIFERAIVVLRNLATERGIKITYEPSELEFKADGNRLEQVMINLISNAIKFSENNSSIHLQAREAGRMVEVKVIDQGRGIPEESRPHVFERFHQLKHSDSERGSGLGLAICKLIVESHSGMIGVRTPESGKGSEFWFKIPYRKVSAH